MVTSKEHHPAHADAFRKRESDLRGGVKHLDSACHTYEIHLLAYEAQESAPFLP
jgi:hypothetical protein